MHTGFYQNVGKIFAFLVLPLPTTCILTYNVKFSERNIFGHFNETVISEIKSQNVVTCYYVATELLYIASCSLPTETQGKLSCFIDNSQKP